MKTNHSNLAALFSVVALMAVSFAFDSNDNPSPTSQEVNNQQISSCQTDISCNVSCCGPFKYKLDRETIIIKPNKPK